MVSGRRPRIERYGAQCTLELHGDAGEYWLVGVEVDQRFSGSRCPTTHERYEDVCV
jgi:hypothetical protein